MRPFRSTRLGSSLKRVVRYLSARVTGSIKYLFAELEYAPKGWRVVKAWDDRNVADAQQRHWPTLVRNLQGRGRWEWRISRGARPAKTGRIIMS